MNSRQRFLITLSGDQPDHPPLFPEGIRQEVIQAWQQQGLTAHAQLEQKFHYDHFEEMEVDLYPRPTIVDWDNKALALHQLSQRLDAGDDRRLPENWELRASQWQNRQNALFMEIHAGLFLTLGVDGWREFAPAIYLLVDDPQFVREVLAIQARFAMLMAERILGQVQVDAVIFSEPIAAAHGPLISPHMYRDLVLPSYAPILETVRRAGVPFVIWRSYANPGPLVDEAVQLGFDAIWACEVPPGTIDYRALRRRYPALGLIGGIDSDVLRQGEPAMRAAIRDAAELAQSRRYVPLADGRVRQDIPYQAYVQYRSTLEEALLSASAHQELAYETSR